jgi:hypothetical protein
VRRAVVSRVLPDGLRIRVTERVPLAVVRTAAGHFVWVDVDGVALGEMKPDDQMPPFFIRGWNEDGTEDARRENADRLQKYQEAVQEWNTLGLTARVSEVNLLDVRDVRVQLAAPDSHIEVRLNSSKDLGRRLQRALVELDRYKQSPGGSSIISVMVGADRVVFGSSGGSVANASPVTSSDQDESRENPRATNTNVAPNKQKTEKPNANDNRRKTDRKAEDPKKPGGGTAVLRFR